MAQEPHIWDPPDPDELCDDEDHNGEVLDLTCLGLPTGFQALFGPGLYSVGSITIGGMTISPARIQVERTGPRTGAITKAGLPAGPWVWEATRGDAE